MSPAACTPGKRAQPFEEGVGEGILLCRLFIFFLGQRQPQNGGVFRDETGIDMGELHETAREQAGAAEEDERKRDLNHNERAAQTTARVG